MHQLRDVVVRLRSGQSERKTARAAGMYSGPRKLDTVFG